jgi:hypothetical protein
MKKLFILGFITIMATVGISCKSNKNVSSFGFSFKTGEPKKGKKPSTAKMMEGTWDLFSIDGKELAKDKVFTYVFKADGNGSMEFKKNISLKWEVKQKDGKEYLATITDKTEEFEIKSINDKEVVLVDKAGDVVLRKK